MHLSRVVKQKNHLQYLIYLTDDVTLPRPHNFMNSGVLIMDSQTTELIRLRSQNQVHLYTFFFQVFDLPMPQQARIAIVNLSLL